MLVLPQRGRGHGLTMFTRRSGSRGLTLVTSPSGLQDSTLAILPQSTHMKFSLQQELATQAYFRKSKTKKQNAYPHSSTHNHNGLTTASAQTTNSCKNWRPQLTSENAKRSLHTSANNHNGLTTASAQTGQQLQGMATPAYFRKSKALTLSTPLHINTMASHPHTAHPHTSRHKDNAWPHRCGPLESMEGLSRWKGREREGNVRGRENERGLEVTGNAACSAYSHRSHQIHIGRCCSQAT